MQTICEQFYKINLRQEEKMKEIELTFQANEFYPNQELQGNIKINYNGRYDSIVINAQIEKSSDVFHYTFLNGKKIDYPYNRFSILKKEIENTNKRNVFVEGPPDKY